MVQQKYVGDTNKIIKSIQDNAKRRVNQYIVETEQKMNALFADKEPNFLENVFGVISFVPSKVHELFKGGIRYGVDLVSGLVTIAHDLVYAVDRAVRDGYQAGDISHELGYAVGNAFLSWYQSTDAALRTVGVNVQNWFTKDKEKIQERERKLKADLKTTARSTDIYRKKLYDAGALNFISTKHSPTDQEFTQYDPSVDRFIEDFYSEGYIKFEEQKNEFFYETIMETFLNEGAAKLAPEYWFNRYEKDLWGDRRFSQTIDQISNTAGSIVAMMYTAKLAGKLVPDSPNKAETVKALSSLLVASSSYGSAMNQALENGASMQDAHTYAISTAMTRLLLNNATGVTSTGSGARNELTQQLLKKVFKNATVSKIIAQGVNQGLKMTLIQELNRGTRFFATGQKETGVVSREQFFSDAFFSMLSGFAIGSGSALFEHLYKQNTLDEKIKKFRENKNRLVSLHGKEKALELLKADFPDLVEYLNSKDTKGIKWGESSFDEKGNLKPIFERDLDLAQLGTLTFKEKAAFILSLDESIRNFITIDYTNETFGIADHFWNIDETYFDNWIPSSSKGRLIVQQHEFAFSKGTMGKDITSGERVKPINLTNPNIDQNTIDVYNKIKDLNTPIVLFSGDDKGNTGFFLNGITYLNVNAFKGLDANATAIKIMAHETIHKIRVNDPETYLELQKARQKLVSFGEAKKDTLYFDISGEVSEKNIFFADKGIKNLLENSNFINNVENSYDSYIQDYQRLGLTGEALQKAVVSAVNEEILAFFVEDILSGGEFIDILANTNNKTFFEKIKNYFTKEAFSFEKDYPITKKTRYELSKMQKTFENATQKIVNRENNVLTYLDNFFSNKTNEFFEAFGDTLKISDQYFYYDKVYLWNQYTQTYNRHDGTIIISGVRVNFSDIFQDIKYDDLEAIVAKLPAPNIETKFRMEKPDYDAIKRESTYKEENKDNYLKLVNKEIDSIDDAIYKLEMESITLKDVKNQLNVLNKLSAQYFNVAEKLAQRKALSDMEKDLITTLITDQRFAKEMAVYKKEQEKLAKPETVERDSHEQLAIYNLNKRFARKLEDAGAAFGVEYVLPENRAYSVGAVRVPISLEKFIAEGKTEKQIEAFIKGDIYRNVATLLNEEIGNIKTNYTGMYDLSHYIDFENKYAEIYVHPKESVILNEAQKILNLKNQVTIEKAEPQILTQAEQNAFEKQQHTEKVDYQVKAFLNEYNFDVQDENIFKVSDTIGYDAINALNYDKNRVITGIPPVNEAAAVVNAGLKKAPVVSVTVPIYYANSFLKQQEILAPAGKRTKTKIVQIENKGATVMVNHAGRNRKYKMATITFVNSDNPHFKDVEDLSLTKKEEYNNPLLETTVLGNPNSIKNIKEILISKGKVEFGVEGSLYDFAVLMRGNDNLNEKVMNANDLDESKMYLLVKGKTKAIADRLQMIDYNHLADVEGSLVIRGFTLYDFLREYERKFGVELGSSADVRYRYESTYTTKKRKFDTDGVLVTDQMAEFMKDAKHIVDGELVSGEIVPVYHGTASAIFNQFSSVLNATFFTDVRENAESYVFDEETRFVTYRFGQNVNTLSDFKQMLEEFNFIVKEKKGLASLYHTADIDSVMFKVGQGVEFKEPIFKSTSLEDLYEEFKENRDYYIEEFGRYGGIFKTYVNITNPYIVDAKGAFWNVINFKGNTLTTNDIVREVRLINNKLPAKDRYDGIIFKNIIDTGSTAIFAEPTNVYVAFKPEQIKSTDNLNPTLSPDIRYRRVPVPKQMELTAEQKQRLEKILPDGLPVSLFVINKDNEFEIKSSEIQKTTPTQKEFVINGAKHSVDEYAIHIKTNVGDADISSSGKRITKLKDLTKDERLIFDALRTTSLNFILFESTGTTLGFSVTRQKPNVVFIQRARLKNIQITEIHLHEHIHEVFKVLPEKAMETGRNLMPLLFEIDNGKVVGKTAVFDGLNKKYGNFFTYIENGYKDLYPYLKDEATLYNTFMNTTINSPKKAQDAVNEATAQIIGTLFSDKNFFEDVLKLSDPNNVVMFYNVYKDVVAKLDKDSPLAKDYKKAFTEIDRLLNKYFAEINKMFPGSKKVYNIKAQNDFIKKFSKEAFTTRKKLLEQYLVEYSTNKKGIATTTLNNIIYIASELGKTVTTFDNIYTKIEQDFTSFKDQIEYLVNEPKGTLQLMGEGIPRQVSKIYSHLKNLLKDVQANGTDGLDITTLDKMYEVVEKLYDAYGYLDPVALDVFDFPEQSVVEKALDDLLDTIAIAANNKGLDILTQADIKAIESEVVNINLLFQDVKNITPANYGVKGSIAELQKSFRITQMKNLANIIDNNIRSATKRIKKQQRASTPRDNKNLTKVKEFGENISEVLKTGALDSNLLYATITDEINNMKQFLDSLNDADVINYLGGDLGIDLYKQELFNIMLQFAALTRNASIIMSNFTTQQLNGIDYHDYTEDDWKRIYSPSAFGRAIGKLVYAFGQKHIALLGDGTQTVDEIAIEVREGIENFVKDNPDKIGLFKNWAGLKGHLMAPQDFYKMYAEIYGGHIPLFGRIYDEWIKATIKEQQVLDKFKKELTKFNKENPKAIANTNKEVKLDKDLFAELDAVTFNNIMKEVRDDLKDIKEHKQTLQKELKDLRREATKLYNEMRDIREQIATATSVYEKTRLQSLLRQKQDDYNIAKQERDKANKALKLYREQTKDINKDTLLDDKITAHLKANPNQDATIRRGTLQWIISRLIREINMLQEQENDDSINPTDHYKKYNYILDVRAEDVKKYGAKQAEDRAKRLYILTDDKEELLKRLDSLMNELDRKTLDFIYRTNEWGYEFANDIHKALYGEDLSKEKYYARFSTVGGNPNFMNETRNWINPKPHSGQLKQTVLGATAPLKAMNSLMALERDMEQTATLYYLGLTEDFLRLTENKAAGATLKDYMTGANNPFGTGNHFIETFKQFMKYTIGYHTEMRNAITKFAAQSRGRYAVAKIGLQPLSIIRAFLQCVYVSINQEINPLNFYKNFGSTIVQPRYKKYLEENNAIYNLMTTGAGIPELYDEIGFFEVGFASIWNSIINVSKKISKVAMTPLRLTTQRIFVALFKSLVDEELKANKNLKFDEALEKANEKLTEILIHDFPNVSAALRPQILNNPDGRMKILTLFQTYRAKRASSIGSKAKIAEGVKGQNQENAKGAGKDWKEKQEKREKKARASFKREIIGQVSMVVMNAIIGVAFANYYGYNEDKEDEEIAFDFFVNELFWNGVVGAVPLLNAITSMLQFDYNTIIRKGYEPSFPGFDEILEIVGLFESVNNGKNVGKKLTQIFGVAGTLLGIPIKNLNREIKAIARLFDGGGNSFAAKTVRFYNSQTVTSAYNKAVKHQDKTKIEGYIRLRFDNNRVIKEMTDLMLADDTIKINLYDIDSFNKTNEKGEKITYEIPPKIKDKYRLLTQRALIALIGSIEYRRLDKKAKARAIQRVINYYHNYMKKVILKEELPEMFDVKKVIANAVK